MLSFQPSKSHPAGEFMKRFIIEQSDEEFYTSHSGLALVGLGLNRFTSLSSSLADMGAPGDLITGIDITLDIDGFVMDNSGSNKENVGPTYQKVDGYLCLPAYLGQEGWMVNQRLLPAWRDKKIGCVIGNKSI
jgi:hypothetical protein